VFMACISTELRKIMKISMASVPVIRKKYVSPEPYCTITQCHDLFSLSACIHVCETDSESER